MRLAILFFTAMLVTLMLVALPAGRAAAQDCEAARCAVQAAIESECGLCGAAANHGRYVSCVAHVVKRLSRDGDPPTIPVNCKGKVKRCAARSTCGKPGFETCTVPTDICDPGTLTCLRTPTVTCATNADCGTRCTTKREGHCPPGGVTGSGSCCAACP